MKNFPKLVYSNKKALKAGESLKGDLYFNKEAREKTVEIFQIANSWRYSHAFLMGSIRSEISTRMARLGIEGITVARIKKMPSIRRKLKRLPYKLNQLQDLGGVRSILPSMDQVDSLVC